MPDEATLRELELIQEVIERQANNSFRIKGWTVTLIVVALIFRTNDIQLFGAFLPLLVFWALDAYFLRQERQYRLLYDWVREIRPDTDEEQFNLDTSRFDNQVEGVSQTMVSNTLAAFYGSIGALLMLYSILSFTVNGGSLLG
jgi:hypothetical protein